MSCSGEIRFRGEVNNFGSVGAFSIPRLDVTCTRQLPCPYISVRSRLPGFASSVALDDDDDDDSGNLKGVVLCVEHALSDNGAPSFASV